jgi:hypothetical protein
MGLHEAQVRYDAGQSCMTDDTAQCAVSTANRSRSMYAVVSLLLPANPAALAYCSCCWCSFACNLAMQDSYQLIVNPGCFHVAHHEGMGAATQQLFWAVRIPVTGGRWCCACCLLQLCSSWACIPKAGIQAAASRCCQPFSAATNTITCKQTWNPSLECMQQTQHVCQQACAVVCCCCPPGWSADGIN